LKNVPRKINGKTIFILISVASLSFLSPILSSHLKQETGLLINNANAQPLETGDYAIDFPEIPHSILDKILNREEVSEPSGDSTSPSLPFPDSDEPGMDESPISSDLSTPPAKIIRGFGDAIPNQYIVVLKNRLPSPPAIEALEARNIGAEVRHVYDSVLRGFSIKVPNERVLEAIQRDPNVAYIEQDMQVQAFPQILPRGVNRVDAELSSTISGNGAGSVNSDIAILDTGIQLSHPDLNVYRQRTFVSGTSSGNDDNGHGTHVAGIAAAKDNSIGVVDMAPGARLWAVKVLGSSGSGSISTVIRGIDYVTQNAGEIDVANKLRLPMYVDLS
jgi:subtilisin